MPVRPSLPTLAVLVALAANGSPAPCRAIDYPLSQGLPFSDVDQGAQMSADGKYAVYLHDAVTDGLLELWSVALAGGTPVRLSTFTAASSSLVFRVSPNSQRVVYTADQSTLGVAELYSIPIAGPEGAWTKLNPTPVANGDVTVFAISPDSSRVVYDADQQTDGSSSSTACRSPAVRRPSSTAL
jgi:Tol biopolymer transport system component